MAFQSAIVVSQLVSVPLLIGYWGLELYGEWLVLVAVPAYLAVTDLGITTAANHAMTMAVGGANSTRAGELYRAAGTVLVVLVGTGGLLVIVSVLLVPVDELLGLTIIRASESKIVFALLAASVLANQFSGLCLAAYTAKGSYGRGFAFMAAALLAETVIGPTVALVAFGTPVGVAASMFIFRTVVLLAMWVDSRRGATWLRGRWGQSAIVHARELARPALSFTTFPAANAFNLQGFLLSVQAALGPLAVATFSTTRTMTRFVLQMLRVVTAVTGPEISRAFGACDDRTIRLIHRRGLHGAVVLALGATVAMAIGGEDLMDLWTNGAIMPTQGLILVLAVVVMVEACWLTSMTVLYATNRMGRIGSTYLLASGVAAIVSYPIARMGGMEAAGGVLLGLELLVGATVLRRSIATAGDSLPEIWRSLPSTIGGAMRRRAGGDGRIQ